MYLISSLLGAGTIAGGGTIQTGECEHFVRDKKVELSWLCMDMATNKVG